MSVQENDLTVKIAFVTALHELTGAHVCGLIKNSSKDKDNPKYTVIHAYGKLGDNKTLSFDGWNNEQNVIDEHLDCFLVTTNNPDHLIAFIDKTYPEEVFIRTKENFKTAILDSYSQQLAL